ncbi:hypothetical protein MLD38_019543 [Melastoma candidum]|uniref:Uncharacterized protein n=1 Tax=Melastoma candidum TaxID=119954 RepID=A0ACB9QYE7_9MYRT|nr:hypothetical protein MLD38_019543 [Melastoma candidum]
MMIPKNHGNLDNLASQIVADDQLRWVAFPSCRTRSPETALSNSLPTLPSRDDSQIYRTCNNVHIQSNVQDKPPLRPLLLSNINVFPHVFSIQGRRGLRSDQRKDDSP